MEAEARRVVKKGAKTDLFEIMERKGRTRLASGVWAEALEENAKMARELVDEAAWALATGLASAQNLLSLPAIIVGGGPGGRPGGVGASAEAPPGTDLRQLATAALAPSGTRRSR